MRSVGNYHSTEQQTVAPVGFGTSSGDNTSLLRKLAVPLLAVGTVWLLYEWWHSSTFYSWDEMPGYAKAAARRRARSSR